MSLRLPFAALLCCASMLGVLRAEELPRAQAVEEAAVRALVGQKSIIVGKVAEAFESPKGMTFLNLEGGKFTAVVWKDRYDKFVGGSPAKLYKGKAVEITGTVIEFRAKGASKESPGKLEIKLYSPEQVKVIGAEAPAPTPSEPAPEDQAAPPAAPDKGAAEKPAAPAEAKAGPVNAKKYFK